MSKTVKPPAANPQPTPAARRAKRLEAALRENLKKRKDQARSRDTGSGDSDPSED